MLSNKILAEVLSNGKFYGRKYYYWRGQRCIYRCLYKDGLVRYPRGYDTEIAKVLPKNLWIEV